MRCTAQPVRSRMTSLKEHLCGSSTSVDTGVETQACSYPQACPHMGKVDVGCGESVVHGSTDGLGRKGDRAEAMRAGLRGSSPAPFVGRLSVMRSSSPVGLLNPLCRVPGT